MGEPKHRFSVYCTTDQWQMMLTADTGAQGSLGTFSIDTRGEALYTPPQAALDRLRDVDRLRR